MATEYLTKPDIDMILESLRYTKEAFQKYQGSTRRVSPSKNARAAARTPRTGSMGRARGRFREVPGLVMVSQACEVPA